MSQKQSRATSSEDERLERYHPSYCAKYEILRGIYPNHRRLTGAKCNCGFEKNIKARDAHRDKLIEARARLDSLQRVSSLHNDHRDITYLSQSGELVSVAEAKAELEAKIKELEGEGE